MKTKHLLSSIFVLVLSPLLASAAVFIKFDGVDGESKDKDHKGWIDLSSVSMRSSGHKDWIDLQSFSQVIHRDVAARNVSSNRDAASGLPTGKREAASGLATGKRDVASGLPTGRRDAASGMATGKRQHKPIRVTKRIDKSTPLLAQALSSGNSMGNVTIQRTQGGKSETMTLVNATVAAVEKTGNTEHVTFNYQQIRQAANPSVRGWDPKDKKVMQGTANSTK